MKDLKKRKINIIEIEMENYMLKLMHRIALALIAVVFMAGALEANAYISEKALKEKEKGGAELQRQAVSLFDLQLNTVSNIEFYTTNYGIFGLDVRNSDGGGYWPRGSRNQYIFGGGIWIAAQKRRQDDPDSLRNMVEVSYNPNNARSWFVPGRISEGDQADPDNITKYRTYFSTDFRQDGEPLIPTDGEAWPIWDSSDDPNDTLRVDRYFGEYIDDNGDRSLSVHPKGPAFISGEDIFATFKDTDLNYFDGGASRRRNDGYPLRLQFEQTIYSWGFGDYRDFIFIAYDIINMSDDTLFNCYMAPVMDVDLARAPNTQAGASNDRCKFYDCDESLNMAVQWTNTDRGEAGHGFGYLGFDFLESPAVDEDLLLRNDKKVYSNEEQIGLTTFRNWNIADDIDDDEQRYLFLSSGLRDGDDGPGDKRFMMSTGPYHMRPDDTARVVVGIILANSAKGQDQADGTCEDMAELERKDIFAQEVYDNNFRAPTPPRRSRFVDWKPLNHGIQITWDSTAELSTDEYESGMSFLGYTLYRARRPDLDAYAVDNISPSQEYPGGRGPLGWRPIASWSIPNAFQKSVRRAGTDPDNTDMPMIDSLRILGPYTDKQGNIIDTMAIRVMRVCSPCEMLPDSVNYAINGSYLPLVSYIDSSSSERPWGSFFREMADEDPNLQLTGTQEGHIWYNYDPEADQIIFDSALVGVVYLNEALINYNPLYYERISTEISSSEYQQLPEDGIIYDTTDQGHVYKQTIYLKDTYKPANVSSGFIIDRLTWRTNFNSIVIDKNHITSTLDFVYNAIQTGVGAAEFPDFTERLDVRNEVIVPYMDEVTNGRTFTDIGDDNLDAEIIFEEEVTDTEKLINNVDYYYKLLAWDEGDYNQPTPSKFNDGQEGLSNFQRTIPYASPVSRDVNFEIIHVDSSEIGGLYDFEFFSIDPDRVKQLFSGDTLELSFEPYWLLRELNIPGREETDTKMFGLYQNEITLRNTRNNEILFNDVSGYEIEPCQLSIRGAFTEDAFSYVIADSTIIDPISKDTIRFGIWDNTEIIQRTGTFTTGNFQSGGFCYTIGTGFLPEPNGMIPPAYGTLGFTFDYSLRQFGGIYRPYDAEVLQSEAITPLNYYQLIGPANLKRDPDIVQSTSAIGVNVTDRRIVPETGLIGGFGTTEFASFNNGPGRYIVEFTEGGLDTLEILWANGGPELFVCEYLNVNVRNVTEYDRPTEDGGNTTVRYPENMDPINIPIDTIISIQGESPRYYPDPRNLPDNDIDPDTFIGKYNLAAYPWVNGFNNNSAFDKRNQLAIPNEYAVNYDLQPRDRVNAGVQNRYYKSGKALNTDDWIDFVHILNIGGVQYIMDYPNKGSINSQGQIWTPVDNYPDTRGPDFQPGDQIAFESFGGAQGFPMPGAKVLVKVTDAETPVDEITDEMMDEIQVVPNPYYISHQGQASPYDAKLYITKLPERCTIQIYTVTGDLIYEAEHDEFNDPDPANHAVEVWDLLSSNSQRVASQSLIAYITTPDGAEVIKNFTIVVGGFNVTQD